MRSNKNIKKWFWFGLGLILLLAGWLRLYQSERVPHGFNADEAALGYNAYSLLQAGRDEHGNRWPLHFESFADFKPGGYVYLLLPLVKVFGLIVWVIRLPSLLAGLGTVLLMALLVNEVFESRSKKLGLLAAVLLAISPWHIQFSRGAWETNVGTFLLTLGVWLFWRGVRRGCFRSELGGLLALVSSAYFYHSMRILAPLLLAFLIWQNRKDFFSSRRRVIIFIGLGVCLSLPLVWDLLAGGAVARFAGVGITGDIGPYWSTNRLRGEHTQMNVWWVRLIHNRPLAYGIKVAENWAAHFNPEFLFIDGDKIRRSNAPEIGQLYWMEVVGLGLGFYYLIKKWRPEFSFWLVWLILAPVPAALTLQSPHALRSQSLVVPLLAIVAWGWWSAGRRLWLMKKWRWLVLFFWLVYTWQVGYFLNQYLVHYPCSEPQVWEDGFDQLVPWLAARENDYERIYVTDKYDQPYILFLFYRQYPPAQFQVEHTLTARDRFGFSTVRDWRNYHFEGIDWSKLADQKNILVVGTDEEIPDAANIVYEVRFQCDQIAFQVAAL